MIITQDDIYEMREIMFILFVKVYIISSLRREEVKQLGILVHCSLFILCSLLLFSFFT